MSKIESVKSLSVGIDNKLEFKNHVARLCKKLSNKLNVFYRIYNLMG